MISLLKYIYTKLVCAVTLDLCDEREHKKSLLIADVLFLDLRAG